MEEKKSIKELSEFGIFLCDLGNGISKSLEDGKISFSDAVYLMKAAMSAPSAFIGIGQIDEEYFDLDEEEKAELGAILAERLDLPQEGIEKVVEGVIRVALEFNGAVASILKAKEA